MKIVDVEQRMALYNKGMLDAEMAEALGIQVTSLAWWRRSMGLPPNKKRAIRNHGDTVIHFIKLLHSLSGHKRMGIDHIGKAMDIYRGGGLCDLY